jgi:RimJ/RimL family protein N-acetyltransferase
MTVIYYQGERIDFRPLEPTDEPLLRTWINDPRVWSTLNFRPPINELREREYLERYGKNDNDIAFGIVVREEDRLIGSCGLHNIKPADRCATFGLMIGDVDYHGRGYGTEATRLTIRFGFEELNLHRIQLNVFAHNAAARRVYEKAGFVQEGCRRQAVYRHGRYRDVYEYGILRDEYDQQAAGQTAERQKKVLVR